MKLHNGVRFPARVLTKRGIEEERPCVILPVTNVAERRRAMATPESDDTARAVRAAVRLMAHHGEDYAVSLACVDLGTAAGRALSDTERADVVRLVREEMARG